MYFYLIDHTGILLEIYNPQNIVINYKDKEIFILYNKGGRPQTWKFDTIKYSEKKENSWFLQVEKARLMLN